LVRGVSMRRGVVVAGDIVDLLAAMFFQHRILTHDLAPLLVLGRIPESRIVAEIEREIPVEGGPAEGAALLSLAKRRRQRLGAHRRWPESDQAVLNAFARGLVGSDMLIADDPQIETSRLLMPYRRSRLRDRGGDRGPDRRGARLEQTSPRGSNRIVHHSLSACAHVDLAVSPTIRLPRGVKSGDRSTRPSLQLWARKVRSSGPVFTCPLVEGQSVVPSND